MLSLDGDVQDLILFWVSEAFRHAHLQILASRGSVVIFSNIYISCFDRTNPSSVAITIAHVDVETAFHW